MLVCGGYGHYSHIKLLVVVLSVLDFAHCFSSFFLIRLTILGTQILLVISWRLDWVFYINVSFKFKILINLKRVVLIFKRELFALARILCEHFCLSFIIFSVTLNVLGLTLIRSWWIHQWAELSWVIECLDCILSFLHLHVLDKLRLRAGTWSASRANFASSTSLTCSSLFVSLVLSAVVLDAQRFEQVFVNIDETLPIDTRVLHLAFFPISIAYTLMLLFFGLVLSLCLNFKAFLWRLFVIWT